MDNSEILNKMLKGAEEAARTASALKNNWMIQFQLYRMN